MTDGAANDKARITDVLTQVLSSHLLGSAAKVKGQTTTIEDLTDAVDYLADEVIDQGITLPSPLPAAEPSSSIDAAVGAALGGEPTLAILEAHPLHALVMTMLQELLLFGPSQASSTAPCIVEETFKAALTPMPVASDAAPNVKHKKGTLGECEICERSMPLTEHHLIPRSQHDRLASKGTFTIEEMRSRLAMLCRPCHTAVHSMIPHEDLASRYNTMDRLLEHEAVCRWGKYASKLKERSAGYEGFGLRNKR